MCWLQFRVEQIFFRRIPEILQRHSHVAGNRYILGEPCAKDFAERDWQLHVAAAFMLGRNDTLAELVDVANSNEVSATHNLLQKNRDFLASVVAVDLDV